ncbi:MAG: hypothetical protein MJB57_02725 [Gemmatimonadetes bacterium]|nr:hypothetical protein [Gemmatimonadota bacterium]
MARSFWGDALDFGPIRFVDSRAARLTGRAFVTHNTIHWPGPSPRDPSPRTMATVVHELAHCWQYQTGRWQLTRGIVEQSLFTLLGWWLLALGGRALYDPYDYGGPTGLAVTTRLASLRLEAQAAVIEDCFKLRSGHFAGARGASFRDEDGDVTPYAADLERLCRDAGLP